LLLLLGLRAIGSVHQFSDCHYRYAYFDFAPNRFELFQNFSNGMASALGT
jgi:hypothetical protein